MAARATHPTLPKDMPAQAQFMQSGYDVAHLEPTGAWVACGTDRAEQANWCRVTDAHGQVVYEGDYLPLLPRDGPAARGDQPAPCRSGKALGSRGLRESAPVPVIPLSNGDFLVPIADRQALADRWAGNPQELQNVAGQ